MICLPLLKLIRMRKDLSKDVRKYKESDVSPYGFAKPLRKGLEVKGTGESIF